MAARWHKPLIGRRGIVWLAIAVAMAASVAGLLKYSGSRRFPPPAPVPGPPPVPAATGSAAPTPSVPGLKPGVPKVVPGIDNLAAFSPSLSADLNTIVFAGWKSRATEYDLYISTRDAVDRPFAPAQRIEATVTPWTEAYPALSADGLELVYLSADDAHPDTRPKLLRSTRANAKAPFAPAEDVPIPEIDAARPRIADPQFVDRLRLKVCLVESQSSRKVCVTSRASASEPFRAPETVGVVNPWILWWLSSDGLRAYCATEEGICVCRRESNAAAFSPPEVLLPEGRVGRADGPIWLTPREDVVFYCSSGPGKPPGAGRQLWMVAF